MTFNFRNYIFNDNEIKLALNQHSNTENIYSIIIGRNGIGKSRLLESIVRNAIENKIDCPENIIVLTNCREDRFPKRLYKSNNYNYIGSPNLNGPTLQSINMFGKFNYINKLLINENIDIKAVAKTLLYLNYHPKIKYEFRFSHRLSEKPKDYKDDVLNTLNLLGISLNQEELLNNFLLNCISIILAKSRYHSNEYLILREPIQTLINLIRKNESNINNRIFEINRNKRRFQIEVYFNKNIQFELGMDIELFKFFMAYDIILTSEIFLYSTNKNEITLSQLSSGQQAILRILLGISSTLSNNSLICIDEPEVSLHPEWQLEIINKIQDFFNPYSNCHFIIATHSPQIISGLIGHNSYIIDLEKNITYSSEDYSKKSADFQLANVFDAPGSNNEYLVRISLTILSKLTKNIELSAEDINHIIFLNKIKDILPDSDAVFYLIEQINALVDL